MMHYRKGVNVEQEVTKKTLPFEDCMPKGRDFLWMRVKGGTDVNNVVSFAKDALDKGEYRTIVWTGIGGGLVKAVSSVEIMKRTYTLYQVTRMCHVITEEHWDPQMEGLDSLVAKRRVPCLHILLTLDKIDDSVNGVQKPNDVSELVRRGGATVLPPSSRNRRNRRGNRDQQQRYPNQGHSGNVGPRPPAQNQQQKPTTSTESQSQSEEQTTKSGESSGAKRKRNNRKSKPKPKPQESHNADSNTPRISSGQQKNNTKTQKKTELQRKET